MNRELVTLSPDDDVYAAMQIFLRRRFSGAPVVDADGRLLGILSEKDCLRVLAGEAWDGLPEGKVRDYMTTTVSTVRADTPLIDVVGRFLGRPYRRFPVVDDDGRVLGQISRRDILRAILEMRDNTYLYGSEDRGVDLEETFGVDSAMRLARRLH